MAPSTSTRLARQSDDVAHVLNWLASPIPNDLAQDLAQMSGELAALGRASLDDAHYHRILDLFFMRVQQLSRNLKARLIEATLPLGKELRAMASLLISAHENVATGYERILAQAGRLTYSKRRPPSAVAAQALHCLSQAFETSCMMASPPPPDLWRRAHALAMTARDNFEPYATITSGITLDAELIYKGLLALAAAQPEGFSPGEVSLASDYLSQYATTVSLQSAPPEEDEAWYWLDVNRDMGPLPLNRRIPPERGNLLYCTFQSLARLLGEHLSALESGTPAGNLRLPDSVGPRSGPATLKRLHSHWASPPHRQHSRRHNTFHAQVCIRLNELWHVLEQGEVAEGAEAGAPHMTEWMVMNEGPSGYAIMHVSGDMEGLAPGIVIALRPSPGKPWNICLVRWMRSDDPEHIEVGLELIAPEARSVQLMLRDGDPAQQPVPCLLLPAVPALRGNAALLAPAGTHSARRFFIVSGDDKTRIMQGRPLSLDLQAGEVELFQFEPDPYPM